MNMLRNLLEDFWDWSGINEQEYSVLKESTNIVEPFYYPHFDELKKICKLQINNDFTRQELDDFLTCIALDAEVEDILLWCKEYADDRFLDKIICAGCVHLQPEARWQIAELLRCCNLPNRMYYLDILCNDSDSYVQKRAKNAKEELIRGDKGTVCVNPFEK